MRVSVHKGPPPERPKATRTSPYADLIERCIALRPGAWIRASWMTVKADDKPAVKSKLRALRRMLREHVNPKRTSDLAVFADGDLFVIEEA